jgi:hypothetical protein
MMAGCSSGTSITTIQTPSASLSPATLAFPSTTVGLTSAALSTTLYNGGTGALTINGVTLTGTNASSFAISANTCGATLATGMSCAISVTFTPGAVTSYSAAISVADNATGSPQTAALTGTGVAATAVSLAPASLAFGGIANGTTAAAMTTVLTNSGAGTLLISGFSITGANASSFLISANTCGATLAAGLSCSISVTFSPAATGTYTATLNVADNAAGSPQMVALTGTGGVPTGAVTPSSLAFATIVINATASAQNVTLTNTGSVLLTYNGATIGGTNAANFAASTAGTCGASGTTIAVGASCTIPVTFTPTSATSFSGTVSVAYNAAGSPKTVTLTGSGEAEPNTCKSINNTSPSGTAPTANYAGTALSGTVKAGLLPVVGSSVQVYAAGTTGNGSAPTLLGSAVTTDSNGKFTVSGSFTCPYSNSVLYAVARGGVVNGSSANAGIVLTGVIGPCNSLTGSPSFTINEATTAATAWAMGQFLAKGGNLGASATNSSGITLAAATAANLVNMVTGSGTGAGFPGTGTAPTARVNSVANLLNACVASSGASSAACTGLYAATATTAGTPSNTLDAAMNLVKNPGTSVGTLYTLSTASAAFSPVLAAAPTDWTLAVTYSGGGMKDPSAVSIDSKGNVFVANYYSVESVFANNGTPLLPNGYAAPNLYESYGQAVDVNDVVWVANEESSYSVNGGLGSITQVTSGGTSPATFSSGGIYFPIAVAFDPSGNAWVADYGNPNAGTVVLSGTGTPLSGSIGYSSPSFDFPAAVATDSKCNAYLANQSSNSLTMVLGDGSSTGDFVVGREPSGVAVDPNDNVWSANYFDNTVGLVAAGGKILSGTGIAGGGLNHPQGIASDGAGNAWVANYRGPTNANAISEFSSASSATPGAAISPSTGWGADAGLLEAYAIAIDASGNVWVTNFGLNTVTEFVGMAVPVKTPLLGPTRVP